MTTTNLPASAPTTRPAGTWPVDYRESLCSWVVTPDARILVTVLGVLYRVTEVLLPQTSTPVIIGLVRQTKTGRDYARGGNLVVEYADDARDVPADMAEVIEYADRCAATVYDAPAAVADRRALDVARAEAASVAAPAAETFTVTLSPRGSISRLDDQVIPGQTADQVAAYRTAYSAAHGSMVSVSVRREEAPAVAAETPQDAPVSDAVMGEARGWLADCGLSTGGDDAAIVARVGREYDGGWSSFVADVAPAMDAPVAPAETAGAPEAVTQQAVTTGARSAERTTFLADILCCALEGGVGYWSAAADIARVDDASETIGWRYDAVTLFETADGDDDCSVGDGRCQGHRVTLDTLASAVSKISKTKRDDCPAAGGFAYRYVQTIRDASIENDACEVDADDADIIVQVAALGSVVYG